MQGKPHNRLCIMRMLSLFLSALALSSCLGKPVLQHQVLGYDEVTRSLEEKLLLMNIPESTALRPSISPRLPA